MKYAFHIIIIVPLNKLLITVLQNSTQSTYGVRHVYVYNNYI